MAVEVFDDIFPYIGGFGLYQYRLLAAVGIGNLILTLCIYGQMFLVITPDHWCSSDIALHSPHDQGYNWTQDELVRWTIPPKTIGNGYENCKRYDINITEVLASGVLSPDPMWATTDCTNGWTYNFTDFYYPTLSTELDLVCEKDWIPPLSQSIFFFGSLLGGPIFGWMGDYFGRLPIAVATHVIGGVFGIWTGLCGGYVSFCIARFFVGLTTDTNCIIIFILSIEYVSSEYRTIVGNLPIVVCMSGLLIVLPWIAVGIGYWRILAIVMAVPHFISLIFPLMLPESARWLIEKGKTDKARLIIEKIAKTNGKTLTPEFKTDLQTYMDKSVAEPDEPSASFLDLLKTPNLRKRFILVIILWVTMLVSYDGNVRNSAEIGGNIFITFTLVALIEVPAVLLGIWLMDSIGRRYTNSLSMGLSGISMLIACCLPQGKPIWATVMLSLVSRLFVTVGTNCGQQYVLEILPTVGRAQGSGLMHTIGFGMVFLSPYIVYMNRYALWAPYLILGLIAISGGVISVYLPETLGEKLPDSLEDGENAFTDQSFFYKPWQRQKEETGVPNVGFVSDAESVIIEEDQQSVVTIQK